MYYLRRLLIRPSYRPTVYDDLRRQAEVIKQEVEGLRQMLIESEQRLTKSENERAAITWEAFRLQLEVEQLKEELSRKRRIG